MSAPEKPTADSLPKYFLRSSFFLGEDKEKCADVYPYGIFEIHSLTGPERSALPFLTRLKVTARSGRQSFATLASEYRACGNCVTARSGGATTLEKTT
jgi:hypothetical protein